MVTLALPSTPSITFVNPSGRDSRRVKLTRNVSVVGTQNTTNDKMAEGHGDRPPYEQCSSSDLVYEEEHDRREYDEEGVLYPGCNQIH